MPERVQLVVGTKEHLIVDTADRLKSLTSLDGTNPRFDVRIENSETWLLEGEAATSMGMSIYCLVNTAGWELDRYELYAQFDNLPESPRLGPFRFEVVA